MSDIRRRLTGDERNAMVALAVAESILAGDVRDTMKPRTKLVSNGARDWGMAVAACRRIMEGLLDTMPYEQLKNLKHNMDCTAFRVGVTRPGLRNDKNDYGMWLSWDMLETLMEAAHDRCTVCTLDRQAQRSCPLCKVLDQLPSDKTGDEAGCGYFTMWGV